ncbi:MULTISPECIES: hypothetical protein [Shewanella]|uniref:PilZ domain-containing protein n=1 Tax=Shewanella japonica TaxID=93973 RepID=A0ABN4YM66_9GAMM|nr:MULTISPECIES: hypothetical protein [Shewanella]ARD23579.1 hypothetical protein SJ2017_3319 [Shewanella japonica]KPZ67398.1 hypothetical protein AN944_04103 [Shewanella sp. P1-14-1]MBQ4889724.1 hypothetical protein [Shewanella sp. MMG014]OBT10676.1 hypothetical protein A9267_07425 [Shewanella sp. UCD-FRSSP16_17]
MDSTLTKEELACFSELFAKTPSAVKKVPEGPNETVSVTTEIPATLASLLGKTQLTLLAEISHYRLWFPLNIAMDELGQFVPKLGIPEVVDTRGADRSWRMNELDNVRIIDFDTNLAIDVLSLSSTGLTLYAPNIDDTEEARQAKLILTKDISFDIEYQVVRSENGVIAATIVVSDESRETLRQFLFSMHKAQHSNLYERVVDSDKTDIEGAEKSLLSLKSET